MSAGVVINRLLQKIWTLSEKTDKHTINHKYIANNTFYCPKLATYCGLFHKHKKIYDSQALYISD